MRSPVLRVVLREICTRLLWSRKGLVFVKQNQEQKRLLEQATSHYQKSINLAEEYLDKRGISLVDAERFRLGVVSQPLVGHEVYQNRLAIPYLTRAGVVDIRFRAIDYSEPKYLGLPGSETRLYNVEAYFQATDWICLCEGEIDTMTLSKLGYPAIGIPGVKNIKSHHYKILSDFDRIYVFADGDTAGRDFAKDLARKVAGVIPITIPDGEDVNSLFIKDGSDWFKGKVAA
jgi:DNA primase